MNPLSGIGSVYTPSTQSINPSNAVNVVSAAAAPTQQPAPAAGTDFSPAYAVEISTEGLAANAASTATAAAANLSIYSEYQLQQMLLSGQITRNEYNAEIAQRGAATAATA